MAEFDPYLKWLGIRQSTRPLDHYTLLGIERFEDDQEVIISAADRQMAHVRSFQTGARGAIAQKVLNQLARARRCLMTEDKKAEYDRTLRVQLKAHFADASTVPPKAAPDSEPDQPVSRPQIAPRTSITHNVPESDVLVDDGILSGERRVRRQKKSSGVLWTVVGGLGGGVCAIIFCYFLLNNLGLFKSEDEAGKVEERVERTIKDSESKERTGDDGESEKQLANGSDEESPKDNQGSPPVEIAESEQENPKVDSPSDSRGDAPSDRLQAFRTKQVQNRLDNLLNRYQTRLDDPNGEPQGELASLRRESQEIIEQHPALNLVNRIEIEFPVASDSGESVVPPEAGTATLETKVAEVSMPTFGSAPPTGSKRVDLPTAIAIEEEEVLVDSLFEAEFKAAKNDLVAGRQLAQRLVIEANRAAVSDSRKYVLLVKAMEVAKKVGDGESAANAFMGLEDNFNNVADWNEIHKTMDSISRKIKTPAQAKVFYSGVQRLSDRAFASGNFGEAEFLAGKGYSVARKQDQPMGRDYYQRVRNYFADLERIQSKNPDTDLNLDSSDPRELLNRGNYLVYLKGDAEGFKYWAKSEKESLSALAAMEIEFEDAPSLATQFELGKAWYEMASEYESFEDHFGLARSASLLRPVLDELNDRDRLVAKVMVGQIDQKFAPIFEDRDTIGEFPSVLKANNIFYFVGNDSSARKQGPSGIFIQFKGSREAYLYFESIENDEVKIREGKTAARHSPAGVYFATRDSRFRMALNGAGRPMELVVEEYDPRRKAFSGKYMFQQSTPPSSLPDGYVE